MPELTISWHTRPGMRVKEPHCFICDSLNGHEWLFQTAKDVFPSVLIAGQWGIVWDLMADKPRTHGEFGNRGPWNCYCVLDYRLTLDDLDPKYQNIADGLRRYRLMLETVK